MVTMIHKIAVRPIVSIQFTHHTVNEPLLQFSESTFAKCYDPLLIPTIFVY